MTNPFEAVINSIFNHRQMFGHTWSKELNDQYGFAIRVLEAAGDELVSWADRLDRTDRRFNSPIGKLLRAIVTAPPDKEGK